MKGRLKHESHGFGTLQLIMLVAVMTCIGYIGVHVINSEKAKKQQNPTSTEETSVAQSGQQQQSIGYIGCSNTRQAVTGYAALSTQDNFWEPYDTNGKTIEVWAEVGDPAWQLLDKQVQRYGQPRSVWVQICENEKRPATYEDVKRAFENLSHHVTTRTFYVSALNSYSPENLCARLGRDGIRDIVGLATQAVGDGLAKAGPTLGPLTEKLTRADLCHPSSPEGEAFLGQQLVNFFDK